MTRTPPGQAGPEARRDRWLANWLPGARRIDTPISTVLLAGERAYKLKRPVRLPFLDYRRPGQRRHWLLQECRLNRRTAPALYLGVQALRGPASAPHLGGRGALLDWVLVMQRLPEGAGMDEMARAGQLDARHAEAIAAHLAAFHAEAPVCRPGHRGGDVEDWARASLEEIAAHPRRPRWLSPTRLGKLSARLLGTLAAQAAWRAARQAAGWVRDGHGDLHLGNLAWLKAQACAYDAIEFEPRWRQIDVMADAAFAFMDLLAHGMPGLAWRVASAYAEQLGDHGGLAGLRSYAAYRALVRAKVALLAGAGPHAAPDARAQLRRYWALAERLSQPPAPARLVLMMGLSGSGKSAAALAALEAIAAAAPAGEGAVRLRADVERKRLHGLAPTQRPHDTGPNEAGTMDAARLYSAAATARTYGGLLAQAGALLRAGVSVVVDAASLRQAERQAFADLAQALGLRFDLLECQARTRIGEQRLRTRAALGQDPSDATVAVRRQQRGFVEPVPAAWSRAAHLRAAAGAPPAARHHRLHNNGSLEALAGQVRAALGLD